jgi:hypothetical protein
MKTAIASALALLLTSVSGQANNLLPDQATLTMGQYVALAKANPFPARELFAVYLGAQGMNAYWKLRADLRDVPYVYCLQEDTLFTVESVVALIDDYVTVDAQSRGMSADKVGLVMVQALQWKYPC